MAYFFAPEQCPGDGFVLRSFQTGDGVLLSEAVTSSYAHLKEFIDWAKPDQTVEDSEQTVRKARGRYLLAEDFQLGVFSEDGQTLLGGTGFHLREGPLEHGAAEIGLWIRQSHANQGLGTRVLNTMLEWGFSKEWPWERLSWRCDARNHVSHRIAQKAQMEHEGTLRNMRMKPGGPLRDTECFAAFRKAWRAPSNDLPLGS